jgi:hypothetical protein
MRTSSIGPASGGPGDAWGDFRPALLSAVVLVLSCMTGPGWAVDYVVDDFRADYSGSAGDLDKVEPGFGDTLLLAAREYRYTAVDPIRLSDSAGNNGISGGSPIVVSHALRGFKAAYIAWPADHRSSAAPTALSSPRGHVMVRSADIQEGQVRVDPLASHIAAWENPPDAFGGSQQSIRSPMYFHFLAEGSRYAGFWASIDPDTYIRYSTQAQAAGGGTPDQWGRYLLYSPGVPVKQRGFGWNSACYVPGTGGTRAVIVYEHPDPNDTEVRWQDLDAGTYQSARIPKPTYGEDHVVSVDSAGNVAVVWREGILPNTSLYAAAFDSSRNLILARTLVQATVFAQDRNYYRPYALANVNNGNFLIAYSRSGRVHYRTLALPAGAQAFSLGAETPLSGAAETCRFPSIAVNGERILFGWFKRAGTADSLVGALYQRLGAGPDAATRRDMPLTSETISFSQPGAAWAEVHNYHAPSIALDSSGSIAAAYDDQHLAKLAITSNFAIFHDSGSFTSKPLRHADLPTPIPLDPAADSLEYLGYRMVTRAASGNPDSVDLAVSLSADGTFAGPEAVFRRFPAGEKGRPGFLKYRVDLFANGPDFVTQTKVDSLVLRYNIKPRRPSIDSIRIGGAPMAAFDPAASYSILTRKDTVRLVVNGTDLDDGAGNMFHLRYGEGIADSAAAVRIGPSAYRAAFTFLPPDTLPDPLPISIVFEDGSGWASIPFDFRPGFRNRAPTGSYSLARNRGLDSGGVFHPSLGGTDTLALQPSQLVELQTGDTATALIRLADLNDDTVSFRMARNGTVLTDRRAAAADLLRLRIAADEAPPLVDTLSATISDADTAVAFRFLVRPNRTPVLDSLAHVSYRLADSTAQAGPFDVVRSFLSDSGIRVPSGLPAVLRAWRSDADLPLGDSVATAWSVYAPRAGCAAGDLSCHDRTAQATGDSLAHAFALPEALLVVRVSDARGAFVERRVRLEYPMLDTAASASFRAGLKALAEDLDFILESGRKDSTVTAEVASLGNVPLQILSVATSVDDRRWLDLRLRWEAPGNPPRADSLILAGRTDSNAVDPGDPVTVAPGSRLTLAFRIFTDSLRGDSVLVDTLVLRTNDLSHPFLRIPIRMVYNDLPLLRIAHRGGRTGPAGGYNDQGLPDLLPVRSSLVFAFSEAVRIPDPARQFRVYSLLDSLKNPAGHRPLPGVFEFRRRAAAAPLARLASSAADSLADTLVFRPAYDAVSDSLKVRPAPGAFIHRDVLRIAVANSVVDRAGNALDLRLDRAARAPGSFDTVFTVRVDTGYFRVVSVQPAEGETNLDPEGTIRVRFNRALAVPPPAGSDTFTALRTDMLRGDSNLGLWIRSTSRGRRKYDFRFIALADGDSTLVFRPRPKFAHYDTVTVTLSGRLADIDGLTLDGNRDGFPSAFYDPSDTTDFHRFTFTTLDQEYYVFPNPFRFGDPRHREKGSITFKNINSLSGFDGNREVTLRIHTMTGDLVYSSRSATGRGAPDTWASMDWDLRNNANHLVGTGVYIYTLMSGQSRLLRKGKVAVIR